MSVRSPLRRPAGKPVGGRPGARERGYDTKWDKERKKYLASNRHCVKCAQAGKVVEASTVDHIVPHRLGAARTPDEMAAGRKLFWDRKNWQSLCTTHHSSTKQREENGGGVRGTSLDGRPTDPAHPWNRWP